MKVLVCDPVSSKCIDILKSAGLEVSYQPKISADELIKQVSEFDAVVVRSRTKITSSVIEAGKKLRVIGRAGVGLDNIDTEAAAKRGIVVLNTPESSTEAVAELVLGFMLSLARKIPIGDRGLKEGRWLKGEMMGIELKGKTLGIVGLGRIGGRVGALAKAFGMKILVYDVIQLPEQLVKSLDAQVVDLDTLLSNSDFVTLHVPLTPETRHMMNKERFAKMKKGAYLINASRGEVVDEEALYMALKEGWLAGAALDVFEHEPPTTEAVKLPNVVCTPHIGAQTVEAQDAAGELLAEKVVKALGVR
ncbi:MAG: D-2-hydroxyacid dehydrogenase [Nitrososphaerales archaeon]